MTFEFLLKEDILFKGISGAHPYVGSEPLLDITLVKEQSKLVL